MIKPKTQSKQRKSKTEITMEQIIYFLKSDDCNINALYVLAVIESIYSPRNIFNPIFFNLLKLVSKVDNLNIEKLQRNKDPETKKLVDQYIKDFCKINKHGEIINKNKEIEYSIQTGLLAVAYQLADNVSKFVRDFYKSDVTVQIEENVMIIWYKNKYRLTFLINELDIQLLSVFNKKTKKVIHYQSKAFMNKDNFYSYLDNLNEYIEYPQELIEMIEI
jgi:hypothetical protein